MLLVRPARSIANCLRTLEIMATEIAWERLKQLESQFSYGSSEKGSYSVETLLDVLLLLYDECCNSTLRRDKNVSEFIEQGKSSFIKAETIGSIRCSVVPYSQFSRLICSQACGDQNKTASTSTRRL